MIEDSVRIDRKVASIPGVGEPNRSLVQGIVSRAYVKVVARFLQLQDQRETFPKPC